jgi:hypothetical protein
MLKHRSVGEDDTRMPPPSFVPADLGKEILTDYIIRFAMAGILSFRETSG